MLVISHLFALAGLASAVASHPVNAGVPNKQAAPTLSYPQLLQETPFSKRMMEIQLEQPSTSRSHQPKSLTKSHSLDSSSSFSSLQSLDDEAYMECNDYFSPPSSPPRPPTPPRPLTRAERYLHRANEHQEKYDDELRTTDRLKMEDREAVMKHVRNTRHHSRETIKAAKSVFSGNHLPSQEDQQGLLHGEQAAEASQARDSITAPVALNRWKAASRAGHHARETAKSGPCVLGSGIACGAGHVVQSAIQATTATPHFVAARYYKAAHQVSVKAPHLGPHGVASKVMKNAIKATAARIGSLVLAHPAHSDNLTANQGFRVDAAV